MTSDSRQVTNDTFVHRVHTQILRVGEITLDASGSRHVRNVLRLAEGDRVEVFDDDGAVGDGSIVALTPEVVMRVERFEPARATEAELIMASAIPKGERSDWMIEKLSELGVSAFIPLAAARSVVLPGGRNKRDRWVRIAIESAKQSRRRGVMKIEELTSVNELIARARADAFYLSTAEDAQPLAFVFASASPSRVTLLIGPEGGWTDEEMHNFDHAGLRGLKLTDTVLRVETAAIAAAAVIASILASNPSKGP